MITPVPRKFTMVDAIVTIAAVAVSTEPDSKTRRRAGLVGVHTMSTVQLLRDTVLLSAVAADYYCNYVIIINSRLLGIKLLCLNMLGTALVGCALLVLYYFNKMAVCVALIKVGVLIFLLSSSLTYYVYGERRLRAFASKADVPDL